MEEKAKRQEKDSNTTKAFQHHLRFSQHRYLAQVIYTLPRLSHLIKHNKDFPITQDKMVESNFFKDLTSCVLAIHITEITKGSLKFKYVLG
jgi:hypothetical protein